MLKNKRIFISGGNGVIGNALVDLLHRQGAILFVGDLKPRPQHWSSDIKYRQGDLNYLTKEEIENFAPEYFFHLAATFERSEESYEFWHENHWHNTNLGTHLLTLLKDSPTLKKVVNCSSYLIYDPQLYNFSQPATKAYSLKEEDPIYPRNLVGVAKLHHEIELRFLNSFNRDKYKSVSARIYRSYGRNSRDIVSRWIRMLLKGETLTVYKKEGIFDYVYADDVAEGLVRLAANEAAEGVFNLATGKSQRISDIIKVLQQHFPDLKMIEKEIDIPFEASEANMDKYEKLIGWKPTRMLSDTIPLMIEYEKNHKFQDNEIAQESNVLITCISQKIPLINAVKLAAKKFGQNVKVYGSDMNSDCLGRHFVDVFWKTPSTDNLTTEEVIEYCTTNKIKAIIPTRDADLPFWASRKEILAQKGIKVMVSNEQSINICLDKILFYETPLTKKFPIIPISTNIDDVESNRFVVKERFGAGSQNIGLDLSKEEAIKHAKILKNPAFQPFVNGQEISADVYIDTFGQVKGVVLRTRDMIVNGESRVTTTFQDSVLEKLCRDLVIALGLYGHVILQIFRTAEGNYQIIECNGRFGGASTLSLVAGLDSFYWFLLEANNQSINDYSFVPSAKNIQQVRHPNDLYLYL